MVTARQFGVSRIANPTTARTKTVSNHLNNKPGEKVRYGRVKCLSWNCGGLPLGTLDELVAYLEAKQFQIAFVQETRWKHTSMWESGSYYCIHSGEDKSGNSWCGVLTLISKSLTTSSLLRFHAPVDGRLLHVRVPTRCGVFDTVNCYQKPLTEYAQCSASREQVWRALDRVLSRVPLRNAVMVSGDYNSPLIKHEPWVGGAACKAPDRYEFEHDTLGELIELHDLCAVTTWKGRSVATCVTAQGGCSTIDGILVRRTHADSQSKLVAPIYSCPFLSSSPTMHYPLCASLPLLWRCWTKGDRPKQFLDRDGLVHDIQHNAEKWQKLVQEATRLLPSPSLSNLEAYNMALRKTCLSLYQVSAQKNQFHQDGSLGAYRHSKWRLFRELRKPSGSGLHAVFKRWWLASRVAILTRLSRRRSKKLRKIRLQNIFEAALSIMAKIVNASSITSNFLAYHSSAAFSG